MQESLRTKRVSVLIKQAISEIVLEEVNDPRVKNLIISDVQVTKDLEQAKVFVNSYLKKDLSDLLKGLNASNGFIRKQLMLRLRIKKVPKLTFELDNIPTEAIKIDALLDKVRVEPKIDE